MNMAYKVLLIFFLPAILLSLHHIFPYLLVGSTIIKISHALHFYVPNNFVVGQIMGGNVDAAKLFMNGELPWHFVYGIFYPINFIYSFLKIESAYIVVDLLTKLIGFFSCLYFLKQFKAKYLLKILISCLFASQIVNTTWGLGVAGFPFIFAVCLREKNIKIKHLVLISLIAMNTDLYLHGVYIFLIVISSLFFLKKDIFIKNIKNLIKIFLTFLIFLVISNSNLFYNIIYFSPFQLSERVEAITFKENILQLFQGIFTPSNVNAYFFPNIILSLLIIVSIIFTLIGRTKNNIPILKLLIFFQLMIFFINLFINLDVFTGTIFTRLSYFLIFFQVLLIFNFLNTLKFLKNTFFLLLIFSIIYNQISPSLFTVIKVKSNYESFTKSEKEKIKKDYKEFNFYRLIQNYNDFSQKALLNSNNTDIRSYQASSFKSYYRSKDFKIIKKLVGEKRTFTIGHDPFVSVVNNIKVTGGYYRYYPLAYKYKYIEIVEDQIKYIEQKSVSSSLTKQISKFKNTGQKLYSFYNEGDEFKINLNKLKELDVKFIVSKYFLENKNLEIVCESCSNIADLNLYKIK